MNDLSRALVGVTALPITYAAQGIHDWMTGKSAILDLEVTRRVDLVDRQQQCQRLRDAARSPRVAGVLLRLREPPGGWAACQDLRSSIRALQESGKKVYAWVEAPGNALMWIAAACDKVFLAPCGEVSLLGVGVELTFFGHALQDLGVHPDFEAAGAYTSFGEPWTRSFASPENQEAVRSMTSDLQVQLLEDIAADRDMTQPNLAAAISRAPLSPEDAMAERLVDRLCYIDEVESWVLEQHGPSCKLVSWKQWAMREGAVRWLSGVGEAGKTVAVVHLEGPIVLEGAKRASQIRARDVLPILRSLREDEMVAAVVLHVNSPGGSALASDLLWREVSLITEDKPVVAVFEDVSASGGFYLSAPANEIIARPASLTGSIGVFGGKLVLGEALRKMGVTTQEVTQAENATLFSPTRPFSDAQRSRFRASLQRFYDGFVERVAAGRNRPSEEVEPHCRGRVWTGRAAQERGLVDRFGDLYTGIERARVLAQLPMGGFRRKDIMTWRRPNPLQRLASETVRGALGPRVMRSFIQRVLGSRLASMLEVILDHQGQALALLPFDIEPR